MSSNLFQKNLDIEKQYQALMKSIPGGVGIFEITDRVRVLHFNDAMVQMCGLTKAEYLRVTRQNVFEVIYEDDREALQKEIEEAVKEDRNIDIEYRLRLKDGGYRWIRLSASRMDAGSERYIYFAVFLDIDELKQREFELLIQQKKINLALENSEISVWEYDIVNQKVLLQDSYQQEERSEHAAAFFSDIKNVHSTSREDFRNLHKHLGRGDRFVTADIRYSSPDNRHIWERIKYVTYYNDDHVPIRAVGCATNLMPLKNMEERYREEVDYRNAIQKDKLIMVLRVNLTLDRIEGVDIVDPVRACDYSGYTFSQSIRNIQQDILNREERQRFEQLFERRVLLERFQQGENEFHLEYRRKYQDEVIWVSTVVKLTQNPLTDDVICFLYTYDVHEERLTRELMRMVVALDYDYVICLNAQNNTYLRFLNEENNRFAPFKEKGNYEEEAEKFITRYAVEEGRDILRESMDIYYILRALENSRTYSVFASVCPEGGQIAYKKIVFTYIDREHKLLLMTQRDVTDVTEKDRQQRENLRDALMAAEQSSRAKSEFLSRMSHEIRTPMNAIIGMTALAQQFSEQPEQVSDCLEKVEASAKFLLSLINDILDMSRIESGRISVRKEKFHMPGFLKNINMICAPQAEDKKLKYHASLGEMTNSYLLGDMMKLQQILINIIANAIKFTPEGGEVIFRTEEIRSESEGSLFRFTVKDTGIGIGREFLPKLFEPFEQEHIGPTSLYGGTGLGLAICKNLAGLMDGSITVESDKGEGTVFTIDIRLGAGSEEGTAQSDGWVDQEALEKNCTQKQPETDCLNGKKVLLVEDHVLNIEVAQRLLMAAGMEVEVAENGLVATEKFADSLNGYYDAILMDIRMPVMDGMEAVRIIREMERDDARSLPIIAMTANAFEEDVEKAKAAGMDAHLAKPIEPKLLYRTLQELI